MNKQSGKITAIYCRVAHGGQGSAEAIQAQRDYLIEYAKAHALKHIRVYSDCGFSGLDLNRPAFQKMLRHIEAGQVGALVVKDVSRLARGTYQSMCFIEETLPRYGVAFHTVKDAPYYHSKPLFAVIEILRKNGGRV